MSVPPARLKRRPDFLRAAAAKRKWVAPGLILQVRDHDETERDSETVPARRVGFTVSRKVGGAVIRSRVKRRLRSAVEEVLVDHAGDHRDYVVIGRQATLNRPYRELLKDLETALKKLDAYRDLGNKGAPSHEDAAA